MFSVDNFYDFFFSTFGVHKTKNLIMTFLPHGSKEWHRLFSIGIDEKKYISNPLLTKETKRIILHDQEPLSLQYLDTYRQWVLEQKKSDVWADLCKNEKELEFIGDSAEKYTGMDFLRNIVKGQGVPIICHSELNSQDIQNLKNHGFTTCYYWWHGMTARDWFRHWQHYDDLFPCDKSSAKYRFLLYARDCTGTRTYRNSVIAHCRRYQDQTLYQWNGTHVDSTYSAKIDINDSTDSAIHLVAETLFDTSKIYLTEKVFKPMVMSQPFILFGPPGSLQYLRNYGFQTFNDIWDESYDLETDSNLRMNKILELIDTIATMPPNEFRNLYQRLLPVIEHNRQRFYSENFQDDLILEMRTNMDRALLEQDQRHQHCLDDESSSNGNDVQ